MLCHSYVYLTPIPVTCDQNPLTDSLPIPWPHGVCPLAFLSHQKLLSIQRVSSLSWWPALLIVVRSPPLQWLLFHSFHPLRPKRPKVFFCGGARDYPEPFLWSQQQRTCFCPGHDNDDDDFYRVSVSVFR